MSTPSLHTLAKVPRGGGLEDALAAALAGTPFNDVTFYTARGDDGGAPRAVHANSRILVSASAYFRELLSAEVGTGPAPSHSTETFATLADGHDSALDEDDIDAAESVLAAPSEVSMEVDGEMELPESEFSDIERIATADSTESGTRRTVTLDNVTADTLEAVVYYIYTGNVYFRPLRSQDLDEDAKATDPLEHPKRPTCCCKAVYRFADEAGLDELKDLADAHLFAQLHKDNILAEVFSPFSAQHPAILRRQVALLLAKHWARALRPALGPTVAQIVRGELPHAASALAMLLGEISPGHAPGACASEGEGEGPLAPCPSPTHYAPSPADLPPADVPATSSPSTATPPARPASPRSAPVVAGRPPASSSLSTPQFAPSDAAAAPPRGGTDARGASAAAAGVAVRSVACAAEGGVRAHGPAADAVPATAARAAPASGGGGESSGSQKGLCTVCNKKTRWTMCSACSERQDGMVKPDDGAGSTRVADGGGVTGISPSGK
ncbi:hypothetical protein PsYK624_086590 [Phanerochaete sordida]|uniref:BTB domain-containing protein n=1 Tax=Phanerochaete sordida TaxID=48140 RepID=A0A9P3GEW9_9APHY|nr:hypothetical protein PsYK624_086590 [Phanerochaete sordida]